MLNHGRSLNLVTKLFNLSKLNSSMLLKTKYQSFSTNAAPKQEFLKHFLVRIQYKNAQDAYYETYPQRQQFRKQIKQLQDSNRCYIFGGDQFPLQTTQFVINCDDKSFVENFLNKVPQLMTYKNVYSSKKLIEKYEIEQVQKVSEEKMKKLSYFYQYL